MQIQIENITDSKKQLDVNIPWEDIQKDFSVQFKEISKQINLPGYRKGKAKKKSDLQNRGLIPSIEAEISDYFLRKYYTKALDEKEINPVNQGKITDLHLTENEPFTFSVEFEIDPPIELFDFKSKFKVVRKIIKVRKKDVENALEDTRTHHAQMESVEGVAEKDHHVVCDYHEIMKDGKKGSDFQDQALKIDPEQKETKWTEQLLGLKVGDEQEITIPTENPENPELRYLVSVKRIEKMVLPKVDDEFAKTVDYKLETVSELRKKLRENLEKFAENENEKSLRQSIANVIVEKSNYEPPESTVEFYIKEMLKDWKKTRPNETIDEEKFEEQYHTMAVWNLKWMKAKGEIINQENLKISAVEVDAEVDKLAEKYPSDKDGVKKFYRQPEQNRKIREDLMEEKLFTLLTEFAKIKDEVIKPTK